MCFFSDNNAVVYTKQSGQAQVAPEQIRAEVVPRTGEAVLLFSIWKSLKNMHNVNICHSMSASVKRMSVEPNFHKATMHTAKIASMLQKTLKGRHGISLRPILNSKMGNESQRLQESWRLNSLAYLCLCVLFYDLFLLNFIAAVNFRVFGISVQPGGQTQWMAARGLEHLRDVETLSVHQGWWACCLTGLYFAVEPSTVHGRPQNLLYQFDVSFASAVPSYINSDKGKKYLYQLAVAYNGE